MGTFSEKPQQPQQNAQAFGDYLLNDEEKALHLTDNAVKIGSRRSQLAVIQSEIVGKTINKFYPNIRTPVIKVSTLGDQVQSKPLYTFGGKSLWTKELEILLTEGIGEFPQIDMIVHSLKDMPTVLPDEFELGCILEREDPRDALVVKAGSSYKHLADLPEGSVVGTSSVRRSAQLLKNYPHLKFKSVRGNVNTRLRKLDDPESEFSCLILAAAGLIRLGLHDRITYLLEVDEMYPAVGQGALGVEIVKGNKRLQKVCEKIGSRSTTLKCIAERALLRTLEGGCSVPVGVWTTFNEKTDSMRLQSIVLSPDGTESIEKELTMKVTSSTDAAKLGEELGDVMIKNGAKKILDAINFGKINEMKQTGLIKKAAQ
ncbi:porphobilinogen deaminase [Brettanomyces nanus]|uniref:Porphobilinogen deaminase n=1 Tax=Eeniella nana TaxID=13502 RepID=A0A875S9W3_EENNA|nr:porphobilinogen deaminase [Brettanomyces nanus]QPG76602.1 porphobilinogen deaminase [Brettanomyces nanus]